MLILGAVAGILLYYLDLKKGISWYRKWYDISHKEPFKGKLDKGFIHGQAFSQRFITGIVISVLVGAIIYAAGSLNLLVLSLSMAVFFIALVGGFYLGPVVFSKIVPRVEEIKSSLEKIDVIEKKLLKKEESAEEVPELEEVPEQKIQKSQVEEEEPKKEDQEDWRKGIKKHLDK